MGILEKLGDIQIPKFGRSDSHKSLSAEERGIIGGNAQPIKRSYISEDEEWRSTWISRTLQLFFLFISLFIAIGVTSFQSSNHGVSGLSARNLFVLLQAIVITAAILAITFANDRYGKLKAIAGATRQIRFQFVISIAQVVLLLVIAFANSISANVKGCKNPDDDSHADDDDYKAKLAGFCKTKKALAAFLWFSMAAWTVSLVFTFLRWRAIRSGGGSKIPPFIPPTHEQGASYEDGAFNAADEDEPYDAPRPMYQNPDARPSGTFGERPFEDPLPSGYNMGQSRQSNPFQDPTPSYDDPYDRIRAQIMRDEQENAQYLR